MKTGGYDITRPANKGKHLMLFNDKSGSMSGTPFKALTEACTEAAKTIFSKTDQGCMFEQVHLCYYESTCRPVKKNTKGAYLAHVQTQSAGGGTYFEPCIDHISKTI